MAQLSEARCSSWRVSSIRALQKNRVTCGISLDTDEDGKGHALKRCVDGDTQGANLIAVPGLQFQQEAIFWPSVDATVFMVAPTNENATGIDAAAQHHKSKSLATITPIIHEVSQKN